MVSALDPGSWGVCSQARRGIYVVLLSKYMLLSHAVPLCIHWYCLKAFAETCLFLANHLMISRNFLEIWQEVDYRKKTTDI